MWVSGDACFCSQRSRGEPWRSSEPSQDSSPPCIQQGLPNTASVDRKRSTLEKRLMPGPGQGK